MPKRRQYHNAKRFLDFERFGYSPKKGTIHTPCLKKPERSVYDLITETLRAGARK